MRSQITDQAALRALAKYGGTLALAFLLSLLFIAGPAPVRAQTPDVPTISFFPRTGSGGTFVRLSGSNFGPGGYPGTVLWNDEVLQTFDIPDGGSFTLLLEIPRFAAEGSYEITVCAGSPCFTDGAGEYSQSDSAPFDLTERMVTFDARIAFVHDPAVQGSAETAQAFADLLTAYGPTVDLVAMAEIENANFSVYDVAIIGPHTGSRSAWGTTAQVEAVQTARRLVGLGEGGYAFFGELQLDIGYPNGATATDRTGVVAGQPQFMAFQTPHNFDTFTQQEIPVFDGAVGSIVIPGTTGATLPLAYATISGDFTTEAVIVHEGCSTLWGFYGDPSGMTREGRSLFANTVFFALGTPCNLNLKTYCAALTSPRDVPSARRLGFDELDNGTVVGDTYADQHGVHFEDSETTQARTYADNANDIGKSHSPPNSVTNSAIGGTSSNVPMRVDFDESQNHVAAWIGNGKGADGEGSDIRATISAYDSAGQLICSTTAFPVPASHEEFVGFYDAMGRIRQLQIDYGTTALSESIDDLTFGPLFSAHTVRACHSTGDGCDPADSATVFVTRNGQPLESKVTSDTDGYLDRSQIQFGDQLWGRIPVRATEHYTTYHTTSEPVVVTHQAFEPDGQMLLELDSPLIVHDLVVSTQWEIDSDFESQLKEELLQVSAHLYDFTDGQMALGQISVYQNYDMWEDADVHIYASNNVHPQAVIGGVTEERVSDPVLPELTYYPGHVFIGSSWSRSGTPIRSAGATDLTADWTIAFAHELGHYLLYLFDTYLGQDEGGDYVPIETCSGSAMGWVYDETNTELIFDEDHWSTACNNTLANQILGRTEWDTVRLWYEDLLLPQESDPGPPAFHAPLTDVTVVPPSAPGADPILDPVYDLAYQEGESASGVARAFITRGDRVLDQGKPVSGTTQISVKGPQVGDRLCLFDVAGTGGWQPSRHQYGCEQLENGDNILNLEKDSAWEPFVELTPVTSRTIAISVTQHISAATGGEGPALRAVLYPEDKNSATEILLARDGDLHTGIFSSSVTATSAYVAVFVDETATESDPRREIMVDYGVGGSGASGPASRWGFVPIISSDGQAQYAAASTLELAEGEFIAWQSMPGNPTVPFDRRQFGSAYKLVAEPANLVEDGTVSIYLPEGASGGQSRARRAPEDRQVPDVSLYFWTGSSWEALDSRQVTDQEDNILIAAPSQGVGIYSLQAIRTDLPDPDEKLYIPLVRQ